MTPNQALKLKTKIKDIRAALAADKKRWGGYYDDSRGLRYLPPQYFIQLGDFSGGLTYLRWFHKNFPDDVGFPDFLFQWTIILFKTGKLKDAEKKVFQTYCSNTYILEKFFGRPIVPIEKYENSNDAIPSFANYFNYSSQQPEWSDFSIWLQKFMGSERFITASNQFIELNKQLKKEPFGDTRNSVIAAIRQLEEGF